MPPMLGKNEINGNLHEMKPVCFYILFESAHIFLSSSVDKIRDFEMRLLKANIFH